jgi:hypothetical protein
MVKKSLTDAVGRAILRSLFYDELSSIETNVAASRIAAAVETMTGQAQALSIRAGAAEYLRHAPGDLSFICTAMADALDGLDEGQWSGLFEPRSAGSIIGSTPWVVEAKEDLQELLARAFIFSRALHRSDEAALAAIIGMKRDGAVFESKLLAPIIKMAGRSWAVARRMKDAGLKNITKKEQHNIIKGAQGDDTDKELELSFSAWRSRFKDINDADAEWLKAGVLKRSSHKAKNIKQRKKIKSSKA